MEVLDQEDKPILGLYAAGNDAGGWESDTYCYVLSGTALAFAINSARIAGENAVRNLNGYWEGFGYPREGGVRCHSLSRTRLHW
jgi:hypothetical protein